MVGMYVDDVLYGLSFVYVGGGVVVLDFGLFDLVNVEVLCGL